MNVLWKRITAAVLLLAGLAVLPASGSAGPALVFDTRNGEILHSHAAFTPWHPASLTKLMTAYVAFQAVRRGEIDLRSPVILPDGAKTPAGEYLLEKGAVVDLGEALKIILVASLNSVAEAIAETVAGSRSEFVAEMNAAADRLGMTDTRYVNPHGLHDPGQVTTARDMALLTRALIRDFPQYQDFFDIPSIRVGATVMPSYNKLIGRFDGTDGMKTGYVCESGFNIVATATRDGQRLAAIVLGGMTEDQRNEVTARLLESGFEDVGAYSLLPSGRPTINGMQRSEATGSPVNMRPYVCGGRKLPADLASFGLREKSATASDAPLPKANPLRQ